jgi:dolichol kinase
VLGHTKTLLGTVTFFIISAAILLGYSVEHMQLAWYGALGLAAVATAIENFGILGLDNLLAPLIVALVLTHITG